MISCSFIGIYSKRTVSFNWFFRLIVFIGIKILFLKYVYCLFVFTPLLMSDKKGEKNSGLYMHVLLCVMHIFYFIGILSFIAYLYMFIDYAYVKGEFLWSLSLNNAYITLYVLSSSKRGRLLAQRPFTLVLMMINSCRHSTNDLVFN